VAVLCLWAAGFVAGFLLMLAIKYVVTGSPWLEIPDWRQANYIESTADLIANTRTNVGYLWEHFLAVLQTPLVAALLAVALATQLIGISWSYTAAAFVISAAIVLSHYVLTLPVGILIEMRTAIAMFVAILVFIFVTPRIAGRKRAILALCALGVFLQYWTINNDNITWFRTVTSTYYGELVRASPLPPAFYRGLVVIGSGAHDLEVKIDQAKNLHPRHAEGLSEASGPDWHGDWRWGAAAREAGFRHIVFCTSESDATCASVIGTFKSEPCETQKGAYCVRGVTSDNYLVISFNVNAMKLSQ
jgi:hypothetical protein